VSKSPEVNLLELLEEPARHVMYNNHISRETLLLTREITAKDIFTP